MTITTPTIITQYTQVLSKPGETYRYRLVDLCDACRAAQPECSKMGRVYNARCEQCGATDVTPPAEPEKSIVYDRETHDYAAYLDGAFIGFARNHVEAEAMLDRVIFDRLLDQRTYEAERQMLALHAAYQRARADGRTADAAQIKQRAVILETAYPGLAHTVKVKVAEGRKAA